MKTAQVLYDTSIYSAYAWQAIEYKAGYLNAVVVQELTAKASGRADIQQYGAWMTDYKKRDRLVTPDENCWYSAGQILNHFLSDESRKHHQRHRPKLDHNRKQNIIRDVLIAVSAKQHGVTVISDNEDFPLIQTYYKFKWLSGREFFG